MSYESGSYTNNATQTKNQVLAIIAGSGILPISVYKECQLNNMKVVIVALEGQTPKDIESYLDNDTPILWIKLGCVQPVLDFFKQWNVTTITMAGAIMRPHIKDLSLDWQGSKWIASIGALFLKGDDALLSGVINLLQAKGFTVAPAHAFLKDLFFTKGMVTKHKLSDDDILSIETGRQLLAALSPFDVGQAVITDGARVLGIEAIEGTAGLLERTILHAGTTHIQQRTGILIKMRKSQQSQYVDIPTIGPDTIDQASRAGLKGIAIEANGVQVLKCGDVLQKLSQYGLFLYAF